MTRTPTQVYKTCHGNHPGTVQLDGRPRRTLPRSPIAIAPRPFTYDALQPGEIRLLNISPSQDRSTPIRAELKHQPLRYGTYEALFYACGNEEPRAIIHVNGQPLTVSDNLLEALRDLRKETNNRTLWVDSICVNQIDGEEREEQLRRMVEIRSHATGVVAWPCDKSGKKAALDDMILDPRLISIRASSPHIRNPALPQIGETDGESLLDIGRSQLYFESSPALTSSPGSPQTNSASSTPGSIGEFHMQQTYSMDFVPFDFGCNDSGNINIDHLGLGQLFSSDDITANITNTPQRKRSLVTAFPDALSDPCNQKAQQTQSISTDSNERISNVVFACPFQRASPQKYHRCLKYTLNRIKDVKQHIYRQHSQPPFYCARCYETFTSPAARDVHSRRADCDKRQPPQFEGISEQQRNELKKTTPKKKPLHEQWFEVWEVVFPGIPRPQSAFIGSYVEEMVPLLRDIWNSKKAEIISGVLDSRGRGDGVDSQLLADVMGSVFDRFEAETTRSSQGNVFEPIGSPGIASFQPAALKESDFLFDFGGTFEQQDWSQIDTPDFDTVRVVDLGNYPCSQIV